MLLALLLFVRVCPLLVWIFIVRHRQRQLIWLRAPGKATRFPFFPIHFFFVFYFIISPLVYLDVPFSLFRLVHISYVPAAGLYTLCVSFSFSYFRPFRLFRPAMCPNRFAVHSKELFRSKIKKKSIAIPITKHHGFFIWTDDWKPSKTISWLRTISLFIIDVVFNFDDSPITFVAFYRSTIARTSNGFNWTTLNVWQSDGALCRFSASFFRFSLTCPYTRFPAVIISCYVFISFVFRFGV